MAKSINAATLLMVISPWIISPLPQQDFCLAIQTINHSDRILELCGLSRPLLVFTSFRTAAQANLAIQMRRLKFSALVFANAYQGFTDNVRITQTNTLSHIHRLTLDGSDALQSIEENSQVDVV
jgi:hypothetical protein